MASKTKELIDILDKMVTLLKQDQESHWSAWMESSKRRLQNSDYSGVEHLLNAYGGMGSFNDLIIGQQMIDGKFKWKDGAAKSNDKLARLRSSAYDIANYIKQNHEIG
ncbi:DUF6966 domain-containing protein [Aliikangiella sp. IMCC44653]